MALNRPSGMTALDRLRAHYDEADLRCRECGYVDEEGGWQATTSGGQIDYRHLCPSCGAVRRRTYRLKSE